MYYKKEYKKNNIKIYDCIIFDAFEIHSFNLKIRKTENFSKLCFLKPFLDPLENITPKLFVIFYYTPASQSHFST